MKREYQFSGFLDGMRYYRQQTPYTCGAACLRMALSPYQEFSEQILAVLSQTIRLGVTPVNLASAAELLDYEVEVYRYASLDTLAQRKGSIVLVNPGLLYFGEPSRSGHFIAVKKVQAEKIIVNDPDMIHGQENKEIDLNIFMRSWEIMDSWLIYIRGEKR